MILLWEESHWLPRKRTLRPLVRRTKIFRSRIERRSHSEGKLPVLLQTRQWLDIYFSGRQPDFCPPLQPSGTHFSADRLANLIHHSLRRNPDLQRYSRGNRPPFRTASHGGTSYRKCHRTQSHQHPDSLPPHSRKQWKPDRIRRRHLAQAVTF